MKYHCSFIICVIITKGESYKDLTVATLNKKRSRGKKTKKKHIRAALFLTSVVTNTIME